MNTLVFSTNINSDRRVYKAACKLSTILNVCRLSIDLEAKYCLLRVEADQVDPQVIIRLLTRTGLHCRLLTASPTNESFR